MQKVSRYLERQAEPVSRNMVEQHVGGKRDYLRRAMDELVASGFLIETHGANRSRLLTFVRSFDGFAPGSPQFAPEASLSGSPLRPSPKGGEGEPNSRVRPFEEDEVERLAGLARKWTP
jgi:hypothetical protein